MEGGLNDKSSAPLFAGIARTIASLGTADFFATLMTVLARQIGADAAMILLFRADEKPVVVADALNSDERKYLYGDYLSGVYRLSPFYHASLRCRAPEVVTLSQVAPDGFRRSEYYRAYFSLIGVRDMAGLFVPGSDGSVFHFSFSRNLDHVAFAASDLAGMQRFLPIATASVAKHLERASPQWSQSAKIGDSARRQLANGLTQRERGVMEAFLAGHSAKSVSRLLGISVETVRVHRRHLYAKLGVRSQAELFTRFLAQVQAAG